MRKDEINVPSAELMEWLKRFVREEQRRARGGQFFPGRWQNQRESRRYIELEQDLNDAETGLEASPPSATAVYMTFADDGKLEKSTADRDRITVINRGRGIAYEKGTRGYILTISGELHFIPIECDPGESSSSAGESFTASVGLP